MAVVDSFAYVADWGSGLRILSVANSQSPYELGYYDTPGSAYGVAVVGGYAYVADGDSGLRVINVVDPQSPTEAGYYDTPGSARGVAVDDSLVYVADGDSGLRIIEFYGDVGTNEVLAPTARVSLLAATVVRSVLFLPEAVSGERSVVGACLLDISGRKVADLHPGANDVSRLSPGVYFVRSGLSAVSREPLAVRKVVVTR